MNLKNSINVNTLDKITKRITCTLVISLLPFICYLTYLDCGNYKNIPIRVVLVYSVLIFINLILVVINYLSIYKNFSTGFFSTYKNNTNVDLDELLNTTEQDINRFNKEVTDLHEKITDLEEKSKSNYVDTEKHRESEEGAKDKESEETGVTLNDVIGTMLNSVCGVTIVEKSPAKSEKELDDYFSQGKTFSQGNRPDMSSVESLNRRANVISLLPFMLQLPFLFTNLHNTKLLSLVAIELVAVGILLIVISKLFTNFYEMFDENKVFPVSVCLNARIIMLLRFAAIAISSCLGTEIFTILKYDKLVYVAMGLIVICVILLDHNYKKTTDEIKKLNK